MIAALHKHNGNPSPNGTAMRIAHVGVLVVACVVAGTAQYYDGPALRGLAQQRGLHLGGNFSHLVYGPNSNNWAASPIIDTHKRIARDHFTILSAGWEMFPGHTWTGPHSSEFAGTRTFIDWCDSNDIAVHFHGLGYVRPNTPSWLYELPTQTQTDLDSIASYYREYTDTTLLTCKDRVHVYDVCNEIIVHGSWTTGSPLWKAFQTVPTDPATGLEYVYYTFSRARALDPPAKLIQLEFNNETICRNSDMLYGLVTTMQSRGVPIDGIGAQMHINTAAKVGTSAHDYPTAEAYFTSIRENFQRFADLGMELWVTELEVAVDESKPLASELERQADVYAEIVRIFLEQPAAVAIKMWGVHDRNLWEVLSDRPFLFDENGQAKPAFYAVQQQLLTYLPFVKAESPCMDAADGSGWSSPWALGAAASFIDSSGYTGSHLLRLGAGGSAARSIDLTGMATARLFYRWRAAGATSACTLVVETKTSTGAWEAARRQTGLSWRTTEQWRRGFVTLPAGNHAADLRIRLRVPAAAPAGLALYLDDIGVMADRSDDTINTSVAPDQQSHLSAAPRVIGSVRTSGNKLLFAVDPLAAFPARMMLFNAAGAVTELSVMPNVTPGWYTVDIADLPNGCYLAALKGMQCTNAIRVIVNR